MAAPAALAVGSAAADTGAAAAGGFGGGNPTSDIDTLVNEMNSTLNQYLNKGLGAASNYTNQAIGQQNTSLNNATNALQTYLGNATQAYQNGANQGVDQFRALQAPYANAGYNALDAYQDSLGLSRPQMGSAALSSALFNSAKVNPLMQGLLSAAKANNNANASLAPTAPNMQTFLNNATQNVTQQQIQDYINQHTASARLRNGQVISPSSQGYSPTEGFAGLSYTGVGAPTSGDNVYLMNNQPQAYQNLYNNSDISSAVKNYLAQQAATPLYNQANTLFQNQNNAYNALNSYLSQSGMTPQQLGVAQAYNQGLFR